MSLIRIQNARSNLRSRTVLRRSGHGGAGRGVGAGESVDRAQDGPAPDVTGRDELFPFERAALFARRINDALPVNRGYIAPVAPLTHRYAEFTDICR